MTKFALGNRKLVRFYLHFGPSNISSFLIIFETKLLFLLAKANIQHLIKSSRRKLKYKRFAL
jgi:hypothetical protein